MCSVTIGGQTSKMSRRQKAADPCKEKARKEEGLAGIVSEALRPKRRRPKEP